jgi:hypothetical protein
MNHTSSFDLDLKYGQIGEESLAKILAGKIEVKTERGTWKSTGNIAIEYMSRGKNSGLLVTEADHWCTILMDGDIIVNIVITPVKQMKKLFIKYFRLGSKVSGGDNNTSKLVLIPLSEILLKGDDVI